MNIARIGSFSEKEIEALREAGTILGAVVKAFDAQEITEVDEATAQLVAAIYDVTARVYRKTGKEN